MVRIKDGVEASIAAAIVNYATPDLTRMAVWSLHSLYPVLPIYVVENGSPDDSAIRLQELASEVPLLHLLECSRNMHHGPGLDLAIRQMDTEWALIFDSDCIAYRAGFLEAMFERAGATKVFMVGQKVFVNDAGYPPAPGEAIHEYIHPKCALVRRAMYLENPPFEKHGVPCLTNEIAAAAKGYGLIDFPVDEYVFHLGRGTASRSGYGLGLRGWLAKQKHRLRRRLRR